VKLAHALMSAGKHDQADEAIGNARAILAEVPDPARELRVLTAEGELLDRRGRYDEGLTR
jgi:hypothetical protein